MNAYDIGLHLGMQKQAQGKGRLLAAPFKWLWRTLRGARAAKPAGAAVKTVGRATPKLRRARVAAGQLPATRLEKLRTTLAQPIGKPIARAAWRGTKAVAPTAGLLGALKFMEPSPEESGKAFARGLQAELGPGGAPGAPGAAPDWWKFMSKQQPLGTTGLTYHPLYGLIGGLGGLGLSSLLGGDEEEKDRSLLTHPLVMAALMGGAGAFLPGLMGAGSPPAAGGGQT